MEPENVGFKILEFTPEENNCKTWFLEHRGKLWILLGPLVASFMLLIDMGSAKVAFCAFIALWIGFYWMTEAIPLAATAFFPLILFPLFGVASSDQIAKSYFNDTLALLLSSFIYAACLEKWNLHTKVALRFLILIGSNPKALMLGFMMVTSFLSMWISNTATTAMMTPLAIAIIDEIELHQVPKKTVPRKADPRKIDPNQKEIDGEKLHLLDPQFEDEVELPSESGSVEDVKKQIDSYAVALLLGVAFSSSIGGVATLIGTGPNLILVQQLRILFPGSPEISFGLWFGIFGPLSVLVTMLAYFILLAIFARRTDFLVDPQILLEKYEELGPFNFPQKVLIADFFLMALLWFTRQGFGPGWRGWSTLFLPKYVTDATVCLFGTILLFFIPDLQNGKWNSKTGYILDNSIWSLIHWDAVLLLAGGFGLATGVSVSGLSNRIRDELGVFNEFPLFFLLLCISVVILFMTEFTSNVSTITVFAPILASLAVAAGQDPRLFMILGTVCCSYAFMLPVATPPNTIVFGTGRVPIRAMCLSGLILNIVAVFALPAWMLMTAGAFGIQIGVVPEWANQTA